MSNSALITGTILSPNCNKPRNHSIDKITIHHFATVANVGGARSVAKAFSNSARQASANYVVDDNDIILGVDEANRSWCSSSPVNDHRAVTIETANDGGAPEWHVSDKTMANLLNLVVDICKRNGIKKLNFTGNADGNLTLHKYFKATNCPGPYLEGKMKWIAEQVNARLGGTTIPAPAPPTVKYPTVETAGTNDLFARVKAGTWNKRATPEKANNIIGTISNGGTYYIQKFDRMGKWSYLPMLDCWISVEAYNVLRPAQERPLTGKKSNEDIAREVIRGDWGNGDERKKRLSAAGYDYAAVQKIVNRMLG